MGAEIIIPLLAQYGSSAALVFVLIAWRRGDFVSRDSHREIVGLLTDRLKEWQARNVETEKERDYFRDLAMRAVTTAEHTAAGRG